MEKCRINPTSDVLVCTSKGVIFDVDGTLYDQLKLRQKISWEMLRFLVAHPTGLTDLKILWDFRKARNKNECLVGNHIEDRQFEWGAKASNTSVERVRQVVQYWMFTKPLLYLNNCCYPGIRELFSQLRGKGIRIGIFSDYPAADKLNVLALRVDVMVSAT